MKMYKIGRISMKEFQELTNFRETKEDYFLSRFIKPCALSNLDKLTTVKIILQDQPSRFIRTAINDGTIKKASLKGYLSSSYTVTKLKEIGKKYGIKISGNKDEIVDQIIKSNIDELNKDYKKSDVYELSIFGKEKLKYYDDRKEKYKNLYLEYITESIKNDLLQEAANAYVFFRNNALSDFGLNVEWNAQAARDLTKKLKEIKNIPHKNLKFIPQEQFTRNVPVAMIQELLGGTNINYSFSEENDNFKFDDLTVCRLISSNQYFHNELKELKSINMKKVEVQTVNDQSVCEYCRSMSNKIFDIDTIPEIPFEKCTCDFGCRCTICGHFSD
jgi:hypothetical protein